MGPILASHAPAVATAPRPLPRRQHIRNRLANEDGVAQLTGTSHYSATQLMGAGVRPPHLGLTHPRGRQHSSGRRFQALGERRLRPQVQRFHTQLVAHGPSVEHRRPRGHLAQHLREHSVADSSFKKYARSFERWKQWTGRQGVPWQLNHSTDRQIALISEFIIDHTQGHNGHQRPVRGATMKTTLCGIRHFFTAAGLVFPSDHPQIRMLLKGAGRLDAPRRSKAPVSVALLEECANALDLDDPADQALWGVLCLAFFFMLRRSEISATTSTSFMWFALKAADVSTVDASGTPTIDPMLASAVCIRLIGSKTNQGGAPTTRMLARSGHPILCPVLGALLLLRARTGLPASIPAAVFTGKNGTPGCVTAAKVSRTIQRAARDLGEDPARFSTHTLRAGGATSMYRAGVDSLTIQFHGRWASDAFKLYTRLCQESVSSVAARMVSGPRASTTLA